MVILIRFVTGSSMRILLKFSLLVASAATMSLASIQCVLSADPETIMLKAGETVDLGPLYWVTNCHSALKSTPAAEVMEGPAELTIAVTAKKILPRKFNCANPVDGAELTVSAAATVKSRTQGKLFIRIKYPTKDGDRQNGREINYTLFPTSQAAPTTQAAPSTQDAK